MGISYFSVVSLQAPIDKMLLFLWCAKINVVSFRAPFLLLTKPFYNTWVSHNSVQFHFGHLLTKCYYLAVRKNQCSFVQSTFSSIDQTFLPYRSISLRAPSDKMLSFLWCAKTNVFSFMAPFLLLTRPFYNLLVSHIVKLSRSSNSIQLEAELVIFPINPATHPTTQNTRKSSFQP